MCFVNSLFSLYDIVKMLSAAFWNNEYSRLSTVIDAGFRLDHSEDAK